VSGFLFTIVTVLLAAKIGGELFERWSQPAVLGELVSGILIGNLGLAGITALDGWKTNESLALVAEIGVILLLFEVGLESELGELLAVGKSAAAVAALGVIAPVVLGYSVSSWFLPGSQWYVHLFAGATLAATSVGITARVLRDLGKIDTGEARIILGAAVLDDVLGLVILAVVSGLVRSIDAVGTAKLTIGPLLTITGKAISFLILAVVAGRLLGGWLLRVGSRARIRGMSVALSVSYCFALAGLAEVIGLAPIVGAFAAGLVLNESHFAGYTRMCARRFEEIVLPISSVFTGVFEKGLNRLAVGVGMIPRGEVGLIFAGIGSSLAAAGKPVFSSDTFSAMVLMVMVTTLATPPLLKALFGKQDSQTSPRGAIGVPADTREKSGGRESRRRYKPRATSKPS